MRSNDLQAYHHRSSSPLTITVGQPLMNQFTTARRLHIVGSAGSGKTTLAQHLSAQLNTPCYELDEIAYAGGFGRKIPLDARLAALQPIIAQPAWVTEGVYLWWTATLMEAADLIIWLDMPVYVNGWRIVARHFRLNRAGTNRHPGNVKLMRFLFHVLRKQIRNTPIIPKAPDDDAATTRAATAEFLRAYAGKVVHCRRPADVVRFRADFLQSANE
jgi:adenylate kinase family enzyme